MCLARIFATYRRSDGTSQSGTQTLSFGKHPSKSPGSFWRADRCNSTRARDDIACDALRKE